MWDWDDWEGPAYTNGSLQYEILTTALTEAQTRVQTLRVYDGEPGVPAPNFDRTRKLDYATFAHLTCLYLPIEGPGENRSSEYLSTCERFPDISGLATLLASAKSLVDLYIDLPQDYSELPLFL